MANNGKKNVYVYVKLLTTTMVYSVNVTSPRLIENSSTFVYRRFDRDYYTRNEF